MQPIISFEQFTFQYGHAAQPTLSDITFHIYPGEKVLIAGRSGSGKSTLAHCINGLIPFSYEGNSTGNVLIAGKDPREGSIFEQSKQVGTILQDQDAQFIGLTVEEDVAFYLENECVKQDNMKKIVSDSLRKVKMHTFHKQSPHELSGGQKQTVSLAGLLTTNADILLFDEPLANLDPLSAIHTIELMKDIHEQYNKTIVIIEHRIEEILKLDLDKVILIDEGKVIAMGTPKEILASNILPRIGLREPIYIEALKRLHFDRNNDVIYPMENLQKEKVSNVIKEWMEKQVILERNAKNKELLKVENLSFSYPNKQKVLENVNLLIYEGEIVALLGHNGAGKSTLAHSLIGINKMKNGKISLKGEDISSWSIRKRGEIISYVMQNPNHMITQSTVFEEVSFTLTLHNFSKEEIKNKVEGILKICGLYPFRNWPIQALSYGQKKRLTIASVLTTNPKLIILDEPTAGQDYYHYKQFMSFIKNLAKKGISFVFITHDMNLALEYTDRAVVLHEGKIIADNTVFDVLGNQETLQRTNLRESSLTKLVKFSGIACPEKFMELYLDSNRREEGA
ncbi:MULTISPECIES: ABC transporter ATP-binding protein [Bacillus]|uniref:ABC transporter ATP-binding protein n=4 Tax=Bacillus cereus group TaxID=86661 RepID=A0A9X0G976_BACCE|nr:MULTISPECIES: ABC transporter ATP-binding protein [Bacillus cereus group]HCX50282.1 ABC transporter ATP-binding protein [Bacillus sp. (in: firmicutes)]AKE17022.1 Duplicated ATPase component MtsB of energizing module of methionine-regulated ECF transporter [Bacillus cereus]AVR32395.1 ATPase component MtsB, methionine-regulated ECF transporter energizing module [Bacillus cereus]KIZ27187.1 ABC transporter ATP-binding protein [Bacillus cereus]KMP19824.1 ABC transporter ATP-binding protein [Baci